MQSNLPFWKCICFIGEPVSVQQMLPVVVAALDRPFSRIRKKRT
jgi:hypothetical protein